MDVAKPYRSICPRLEGELLSVLAGTTHPLTGREVARLVKLGSQTGVNRALRRLVEHGIVVAQEAGASILYTLNRDHVAAPVVEQLAGLWAEFLRRLRDAVGSWPIAPYHASLFGSAARGDGDTSSDIDLFLVRPESVDENDPRWRSQVDQWVQDVWHWSGNRAGLAEVSLKQIGRLRRLRPVIVAELLSDAITLFGPPVKELF